MNTSKGLRLKYKFWLETEVGENLMGEGKWLLLKSIRDTGSIQSAVKDRGYAYRQTWDNLKKLEERLGFPVIHKIRGGEQGGHTRLTEKGELIVSFFDSLYAQAEPELERVFQQMMAQLQRISDNEDASNDDAPEQL
ncbi:MAG TPA: LysR family transcriptional regulator [Bacteroidales bacterium]|nr:LysR family transcriptional regulator [Bacteroidales bacterium]HQQ12677.1 LysR family transcriptional regulator [Bacteroidales bacterium]